jgi:hypothetical protein
MTAMPSAMPTLCAALSELGLSNTCRQHTLAAVQQTAGLNSLQDNTLMGDKGSHAQLLRWCRLIGVQVPLSAAYALPPLLL